MSYILPYPDPLDAFLAIWSCLPQPVSALIYANLFFFGLVAIVKVVK